MNYLSILKFAIPLALVAGLYFYAHDAGWRKRDATVADEIKAAVHESVDKERAACEKELKLIGGIADELQKQKDNTSNLYADAVGKLYDATHNRNKGAGFTSPAIGDSLPPRAGRLYYADPAGALPAIQRARIATDQANQLMGCQAYIRGVMALEGG